MKISSFLCIVYHLTSKIQTRFARTIVLFAVLHTILYYDLVLVSLNDKIIRYMFQAKNQMFLFYFNYVDYT